MARNFKTRTNKKPVNNTKCVVYEIRCPYTDKVVYIGYTNNFLLRKSYHLNSTWEKNLKSTWIKKILSEGSKPVFNIIREFGSRIEAMAFESEQIKSLNPPLNSVK